MPVFCDASAVDEKRLDRRDLNRVGKTGVFFAKARVPAHDDQSKGRFRSLAPDAQPGKRTIRGIKNSGVFRELFQLDVECPRTGIMAVIKQGPADSADIRPPAGGFDAARDAIPTDAFQSFEPWQTAYAFPSKMPPAPSISAITIRCFLPFIRFCSSLYFQVFGAARTSKGAQKCTPFIVFTIGIPRLPACGFFLNPRPRPRPSWPFRRSSRRCCREPRRNARRRWRKNPGPGSWSEDPLRT